MVVSNNGTNHGLHLMLTILTCGLWLPIWIIMVIVNGGRFITDRLIDSIHGVASVDALGSRLLDAVSC